MAEHNQPALTAAGWAFLVLFGLLFVALYQTGSCSEECDAEWTDRRAAIARMQALRERERSAVGVELVMVQEALAGATAEALAADAALDRCLAGE